MSDCELRLNKQLLEKARGDAFEPTLFYVIQAAESPGHVGRGLGVLVVLIAFAMAENLSTAGGVEILISTFRVLACSVSCLGMFETVLSDRLIF